MCGACSSSHAPHFYDRDHAAGTVIPQADSPGAVHSKVSTRRNGSVSGANSIDAWRPTQAIEGNGRFTGETGSLQQPTAKSEPITLNLVNVSIAQAAKSILGDLLKANFVIDDRVKGTITVQTEHPTDLQSILAIFEASLRGNNAVLVKNGDFYRIVPSDGQPALAGHLDVRSQGQRSNTHAIGSRAEVIPLKFVSGREMERILRPMVRRDMVLSVDPIRNLITIQGMHHEIESIADAIRVFDVDFMKGMSFAMVPVTASDVEGLTSEVDRMFFNDRDGPVKGVVRFIASRRLNSILIVTSQPKYLKSAEAWVRRLDTSGKAVQERHFVYHVQNRTSGELGAILRKMFVSEGDNSSSGSTASMATPSAQSPLLSPRTNGVASGSSNLPTPGSTTSSARMFDRPAESPSGRSAEPDSAISNPNLDDGGGATGRKDRIRIVADETNNTLLIHARPAEYQQIIGILERVDVVPNQVLLETTIAEVTINDELKFGLRWFFQNRNNKFTLSDTAAGAVASRFPGFSYFFSTPDASVALNALSNVTDVKVISSPSLMVVDNKTATLQVGDQIPIVTQSAVGVTTPGAPIINTVQFRDTGVILSVTPRVSDSGRVTLTIEQEVSDVTKTTSSGIDSPTIQQRRIKTTIAVNDGQSIALGGLMQDKRKKASNQVPLLGDIPIVGNLFKDKSDNMDRTELVIMLTPRVVRDATESRVVSDELRRRLNHEFIAVPAGRPTRREAIDRVIR